MGEVYRARDTRLGREVAIKVLPANVAADPERLARFEREAKAVSALNHPNIVTLHEVGTSEAGPYLVLERVEGQSLRDLIDAGTLPIRKLLDLGAQIAAGLAKAHAAGIVHRDLKPDNVMVTSDGFAKILDFGLVRLVWPDEGLGDAAETATLVKQTASGVILGTLGYLSPEQAAGKPADYRADQFAFGALLYEMATGRRPFKRDTVLDSLAATVRDEPEPARTRRADLPVPVAWLIERCLAKQPDDRYASTKDLAKDLVELRDRLSEISRVPAGEALQAASHRALAVAALGDRTRGGVRAGGGDVRRCEAHSAAAAPLLSPAHVSARPRDRRAIQPGRPHGVLQRGVRRRAVARLRRPNSIGRSPNCSTLRRPVSCWASRPRTSSRCS